MRLIDALLPWLMVTIAFAPLAHSQQRIDIQGVGEVPHYAARLLLPISLAPKGQQATIVDMDLCGGAGNTGSLLAIILPGARPEELLLDKTSCELKSAILAKRIFDSDPTISWVGIGTINGAWADYRITLSTGPMTIYKRDLSVDKTFSAEVSALGSVLAISTASITVSPGNYTLDLAAKLWFTSSGVTASLFPAEAKTEGAHAILPVFDQQPGGLRDTVVRLGYSDLNYFNGVLTPAGFDVSTSGGAVHVADLQVSGSKDNLISTALLSSAGLPTFNATITATGDDLALAGISITPQLDCKGKTGVALIQCGIELNASQAAANALSQNLTTMYKGYPLRPTGKTAKTAIGLGNLHYWLNSTMTKCHASDDALYLMGTLFVEERK